MTEKVVKDGVFCDRSLRDCSPLTRCSSWSARWCGGTPRQSETTWTIERRSNWRTPTAAGYASMTGRGRPRGAATFPMTEIQRWRQNKLSLKLTIEAPKSASLGLENRLENMNVQTGRCSERQWRSRSRRMTNQSRCFILRNAFFNRVSLHDILNPFTY